MNTIAKMMSLLSLDVYNRGYNPGIGSNSSEIGEAAMENSEGLGLNGLGSFELIDRSTLGVISTPNNNGVYDDWKDINFYAQAYRATENILDENNNIEIAQGTVTLPIEELMLFHFQAIF